MNNKPVSTATTSFSTYTDAYTTTTNTNNVIPGRAKAAFSGHGRKIQEEETATDRTSSSIRGNGE